MTIGSDEDFSMLWPNRCIFTRWTTDLDLVLNSGVDHDVLVKLSLPHVSLIELPHLVKKSGGGRVGSAASPPYWFTVIQACDDGRSRELRNQMRK